MAGVYIHIPYCKVKCHYCDFHFSVKTDSKGRMVDSLLREIELRSDFFQAQTKIETIYFGGGTPSILEATELNRILHKIAQTFELAESPEITIECNPDDITTEKLQAYQKMGINRLSIGIQSFDDKALKEMNRAHSAVEAIESIENAKAAGFQNITIDLIYGIPNQTIHDWEAELDRMIELNIPHLSAYCLTIEPNTVFGHLHKKGVLSLPNDHEYLSFFKLLRAKTKEAGMEHYEISNFAKPNYISKHNSAYWKGKPYIGIGPSAHSYDGKRRSWNIANNFKYMDALESGEWFSELEELDATDVFNDYLITRLRTKWGIIRDELKEISAKDYTYTEPILGKLIGEGKLIEADGQINLTEEGMFISDAILEDLFCLNDVEK